MANVTPRGRGKRRLVNEINVVPYIDVMLVLLVIFMVTAPFVPTGTVELPRVGQTPNNPEAFIEVSVYADGKLVVESRRLPTETRREIPRAALADTIREIAAGNNDIPVVISGDKAVVYDAVLSVMDELKRIGRQRVGLMVRTPAR
ncbi:MAG: ExbD/TolR family protein [Burkholderiaceae bacterium]|jgi:biopolymer transport protein TolR